MYYQGQVSADGAAQQILAARQVGSGEESSGPASGKHQTGSGGDGTTRALAVEGLQGLAEDVGVLLPDQLAPEGFGRRSGPGDGGCGADSGLGQGGCTVAVEHRVGRQVRAGTCLSEKTAVESYGDVVEHGHRPSLLSGNRHRLRGRPVQVFPPVGIDHPPATVWRRSGSVWSGSVSG